MYNPLSTIKQLATDWFQQKHWLSPKKSSSPEELRQMKRQITEFPAMARVDVDDHPAR